MTTRTIVDIELGAQCRLRAHRSARARRADRRGAADHGRHAHERTHGRPVYSLEAAYREKARTEEVRYLYLNLNK